MRRVQGGATEGVVECLWCGLRARLGERLLGFGGRGRAGDSSNFVGNRVGEVKKRFALELEVSGSILVGL